MEKTDHPCQFPIAIPQRLIKALTLPDGMVLDPFAGSGTTGAAAILEGRRFAGSEITPKYYKTAHKRLRDTINGTLRIREDKPVVAPNPNSAVAKLPEEFKRIREEKNGEKH